MRLSVNVLVAAFTFPLHFSFNTFLLLLICLPYRRIHSREYSGESRLCCSMGAAKQPRRNPLPPVQLSGARVQKELKEVSVAAFTSMIYTIESRVLSLKPGPRSQGMEGRILMGSLICDLFSLPLFFASLFSTSVVYLLPLSVMFQIRKPIKLMDKSFMITLQ